ncbi:MAG TPA: glycosyltransferase family 4 protein [Solirubrobacterales bacterium]|nr:glycosyltransferase family 4 protein [Solirubrobacterales bacterium]
MSYGIKEYRGLVSRFTEFVRSSVPEDATILVVSKGDQELLDIDVCTTWHFPQRTDGTYAGYYPFDSASAISHLESLRKKGGEYLAFPISALWWLDHYAELRQHLDHRYRVVSQDSSAGVIYDLSGVAASGNGAAPPVTAGKPPDPPEPAKKKSAVEMLFSTEHYAEQSNRSFRTLEEAVTHYGEVGQHEGLDPHPLFDTQWYLARNPDVGASKSNPLLHFIEHSTVKGLDPNPYFDTEYYYSQVPRLRKAGTNALVHYVDPESRAAHPNPLFRDGFYRNNSRNARSSAPTPLEHYLRYGKAEGRAMSHIHEKLLFQVRGDSSALQRGSWTKDTVLWFTGGAAAGRWPPIPAMADRLAAEHHIGSLVVSYVASPAEPGTARSSEPFVLEDYALACEIFRPSALRLLAFALTGSNPLYAVCDVPEILETLAGNGVECYFLFPDDGRGLREGDLDVVFRHSRRVVVSSRERAKAISKRSRRSRDKVSACLPGRSRPSADGYADALLKLASKDLGVSGHRPVKRRKKIAQPKIVIPCSDWAVSGVNASMESIGLQLTELGWDLEVLFTRDEAAVRESSLDHPLPLIPYRFLERDRKGPPGVWNALLGDLESQAPCILFMAYDFLANSAAAALTESVGIVTWVQADDRDYYEQVYRLGRYCNAVICVSEVLRDRVAEMNPVIGEHTRVIHNSSVRQEDVARRRARKGDKMRLVYTGRLVQYQKRILDFIDLAQALDRTGVPYEITLIGTFSAHDGTRDQFERLGAPHIADGRINLAGRMRREEIMEVLTAQDFFVLLSDFEGLPLALVEAMARGCVPVTAQSPSGIPEIVTSGENGYIVEGRNYDAWAALLTELWQDPRAQIELSRKARATIRERFTVERIGAQFDQAFRQVAAEIQSGKYERPRSLNWGGERSHAGDVLPSPNLFRPASLQIPGLQ